MLMYDNYLSLKLKFTFKVEAEEIIIDNNDNNNQSNNSNSKNINLQNKQLSSMNILINFIKANRITSLFLYKRIINPKLEKTSFHFIYYPPT